MAERKRVMNSFTLSREIVDLITYVHDRTDVPKSKIVERALREYYADYLKELEV